MYFTLGLKKLPFEPDCNQIIYIEGQHDEEVNELIQLNFHRIRECFAAKSYDFCYIPFLKHDLTSGERLHYNAPYAKSSKEADLMVNDNFILDYMIHPENREKIPPSLLYYHPNCWNNHYAEADNQFRGVSISVSSFEGDKGLSGLLVEILRDIKRHRTPLIKNQNKSEQEPVEVSDDDDNILFRDDDDWDYDADFFFDSESKMLIEEVWERIDKLRLKGPEALLIDILFRKRKQKLSRLHITKDYRIFLPDYFGMEIEMTPLPKAVFLLFMKHPEGIKFSYLPDYREELMDIYKKVKGPSFNLHVASKSIEDVTDPLSNSINEKCSRIRAAFISKFDEHLAKFYYIDGVWGEAKKIALPRNLVKWT